MIPHVANVIKLYQGSDHYREAVKAYEELQVSMVPTDSNTFLMVNNYLLTQLYIQNGLHTCECSYGIAQKDQKKHKKIFRITPT